MRFGLIVLLAFCVVLVRPANADIQNPGFELGNVNWTLTPGGTGIYLDSWNAHTGVWVAYKNLFDGGEGTISQTIDTIVGDQYLVKFWFSSNGATGDPFVSFGGYTGFTHTGYHPGGYEMESFTVTATGASSTFLFGGPIYSGTFFIDDISISDVTPSGAVPEPASILLLVPVAGLLALRRKRARS